MSSADDDTPGGLIIPFQQSSSDAFYEPEFHAVVKEYKRLLESKDKAALDQYVEERKADAIQRIKVSLFLSIELVIRLNGALDLRSSTPLSRGGVARSRRKKARKRKRGYENVGQRECIVTFQHRHYYQTHF